MKNTENSHTPAPWFSHESEEMIFISNDSDITKGTVIGTTTMSDGQSWSGSIESDRANAKLIARAPELLKENEQLKITIDRIKTEDEVKGYEINKVKALNAELLEALKAAKDELGFLYVNNTKLTSFQPEKQIFETINSAIAKAEGKNLVVS